jgi:thiamine biosynthesis lipoprotein
MNTSVAIQWCADESHTADALQGLFRACEQSLSRFDASSELARLNNCEQAVCPLSAQLYGVLEAALWAAQYTQGLYDPTLLTALEQAGYNCSFENIATQAGSDTQAGKTSAAGPGLSPADAASLPAWNWRHVQLLPELQAVRRPPGLRFDLGGIGKGWAVDRTADLLHGQGPYLVNAGGDLYAAGKPDGARGWTLYIEHPWQPQCWIAQVQMEDAALATSTVAKRRWCKDGAQQHHLIDPRSGRPAQTGVVAVSTIARRTALAEVLAKAALLLGAEEGLAYLARMADVDGLIVRSDGKVLYTAGFERHLLAIDEQGRRLTAT